MILLINLFGLYSTAEYQKINEDDMDDKEKRKYMKQELYVLDIEIVTKRRHSYDNIKFVTLRCHDEILL